MEWVMVLCRGTDYDGSETDGNGVREEFDHIYYDLMYSVDTTQDYYMVLSGLEVILTELHKELPHIYSVVFNQIMQDVTRVVS